MVIQKLNEAVRGWVGYFYYGNCSRDLTKLKEFLDERVRIYLRRKHAKKSRGYKDYPYRYLYDNLGSIQDTDDCSMDSELRKPLEEDDRKAVFGKTECTV